jgi:ADP-heptose:LPS heptosyltransferase
VAVPALRSLRAGFPDAEITLISLPWADELARRLPGYVDRFVPFGGFPGLTDIPYVPERSERFVAEQRARGYDLVIQMHGSGGQSNPCAHALGGGLTAGHYLGMRPSYLAPAAPYPEHLPEVLRCLHLARLLGCPDTGTELELPLLPADRREAAHLLGPLAGDRPPSPRSAAGPPSALPPPRMPSPAGWARPSW